MYFLEKLRSSNAGGICRFMYIYTCIFSIMYQVAKACQALPPQGVCALANLGVKTYVKRT
jgi:hypothetical protein